MTNDESPVDVAAVDAAAPGDEAPRGDAAAEQVSASGSAPRRRRAASPSSRTTRARKTASQPTDPIPAPSETQEAAPSVPDMSAAPGILAQASDVPASAEGGAAETAPAATKRPARRPATRRHTAAAEPAQTDGTPPPVAESRDPVAPELVTEQAGPAAAAAAAPAPLTRPTRNRRTARGRGKAEAAVEAAPGAEQVPSTEMEAPVVETPVSADAPTAPEPIGEPVTRTRRTPRGRRRGAPEALASETDTAVAAAPLVESPLPVVEPPVQTVAEEMVAEPAKGRGRRAAAPRKRAEAPVELQKGARLVTRRGVVDLVINGQTVPPVLFFGNMDGAKEQRRVVSEVQRAAQAGVHLYSTLIELICPLPPEDVVYDMLDTRIQALLDADPQGYVIPRIVFVPAPGWRKQYPNEVNHYADGTTDDPSIASDLFWREAEQAIGAVVEHVRRTTYGERVIGYHLERGEWFHPADGGYDRSYANREAFRTWLRHKYKNSEAALRASWYDGQVQFYTAEIPAAPTSPRPELAFLEPRRDRCTIDFLEYTSDITADRLISLARAIKEASDGQALVSVCYGYTFEFGHTYSGHLSLGKVLSSTAIDILSGPPSYRDRQAGGAGSFPSPVHSCALHGKLWISEDDTKTYLAAGAESPDDFNPRIENRFFTEQVQERAVGKSLAYQCGISWMDTWGEGWLDSPDVWQQPGQGVTRLASYLPLRKPPAPEVAFIVGEKSLCHVQRGEAFVRRILQDHRDMAQRCGASVGFYLQSDLTARAFPTDAKLYVFLTPYRLSGEQREAIKEKLQSNKKTLVWLFAPGTCDSRGEPEESAHELVGITLRQQSWNSEVGSRIVDSRHPIVSQMHQRTVGIRERLNPSFYIDDENPRVTILAEYQQSGLPSIAVRELDGWSSVFCGEPTLSMDLLRGLCKYAGVHLFTPTGDDYLFAGDGWITLHCVREGQKTLALPAPAAVFDMTENRFLGEDLREVRLAVRARTTHRLCVGTIESLRKLGFPGVEKAARARRGRAAARPETVAAEAVETLADMLPPSETHLPIESSAPLDGVVDEMEPIEVAADGPEGENGAAGESEQDRHRRRRRRGGRGRGRRGGRGGAPAGAPAGDAPAG